MRIVKERIYFRPSLDFEFNNLKELEEYFIATVAELLPAEETAREVAISYFTKSDIVWYINADVCVEIVLKDYETCEKTRKFFDHLFDNCEYWIEEFWNIIGDSDYNH